MTRASDQPNGPNEDEHTPLISNLSSRMGNSSRVGTLSHSLRDEDNNHLYEDNRAWVRWPMKFLHLTWQVLSSSYVNVLLVFVPVGIVLGALDINPTAIFIVNFLAIMPLAALLSFATEELSAKMGQTLGGLMNATFGNAVELIVSYMSKLIEGRADIHRFRSLLWPKARSASFKQVCSVPFCPTSSWCLDAVSSLLAFVAIRVDSTRRLHPRCRP